MKVDLMRIKTLLTGALFCAVLLACHSGAAPAAAQTAAPRDARPATAPAPAPAPVVAQAAPPPAPAPAPRNAAPVDELDAAIREASTYLNGRVPKGSKAVFLNIKSDYPDLSEYILSVLSENAVNDGVFSVVDRQQLDLVRAELDFQMSAEVSDESAQSIGKMLGAECIVSGAVGKIGSLYRLQVKAIAVQTAAVQGQWSRNVPNSNVTIAALTERYAPAPAAASRNAAPATTPAPVAAVPAQPPAPVEKVYQIGEKGPAGGLIFYDKGNNTGGWRYLEAAPVMTEKTLPIFGGDWMYNPSICGDKRVGAGKENTRIWMIEINKKGGGINTAQWYCDQLMVGGCNDWYLPTQDELLYMYNSFSNGLGDFQGKEYWASNDTKGTYYNLIFVDFSNGQIGTSRGGNRLVRAVRQF